MNLFAIDNFLFEQGRKAGMPCPDCRGAEGFWPITAFCEKHQQERVELLDEKLNQEAFEDLRDGTTL